MTRDRLHNKYQIRRNNALVATAETAEAVPAAIQADKDHLNQCAAEGWIDSGYSPEQHHYSVWHKGRIVRLPF